MDKNSDQFSRIIIYFLENFVLELYKRHFGQKMQNNFNEEFFIIPGIRLPRTHLIRPKLDTQVNDSANTDDRSKVEHCAQVDDHERWWTFFQVKLGGLVFSFPFLLDISRRSFQLHSYLSNCKWSLQIQQYQSNCYVDKMRCI